MSTPMPHRVRTVPVHRSGGTPARPAAEEPAYDRNAPAETVTREQYGRHRGEARPGLYRYPGNADPQTSRAALRVLTDDRKETMTDDRTAVLQPTGRLNMVAAPAFKSMVEETVASGQTRIVVDLGQVTFIDSSGLGALIAGLKATRQAGGDLRIADVPEQVLTVLRLTNLDRVLRAHPTVADASHDW
jgi:anti-sigma B factor antagonist